MWNLWKLISAMEYKGQWVIVTLSQNSDFFLAIVNLQYLTIVIKSELQDVNSQFQYRSEL